MRAFVLSLVVAANLIGCSPEPAITGEVKSAIAFQTSCNVEPDQYAAWGPTCYYASANCSRWMWRYFWRSSAGRLVERTYVDGNGWDDTCWDLSPFDRTRTMDHGDPWNVGDRYSEVRVTTNSGRYIWDTTDGGDSWMQFQ